MENFLSQITIGMVWTISVIELILLVFSVYKFIKIKSPFLLVIALITFGLFFDALMISIGSLTSAENFIFLSRLRFVLHVGLVPLLIILGELALSLQKKYKIITYIVTGLLIIIGLISTFISSYQVIEIAGVSRLVVNKELTNKFIQKIPNIINIVSIIALLITGIIVLIKEKNVYLLLSSSLMLIFSIIGPVFKLYNYLFLISMPGEVCLMLFALLYFFKKQKSIIKE